MFLYAYVNCVRALVLVGLDLSSCVSAWHHVSELHVLQAAEDAAQEAALHCMVNDLVDGLLQDVEHYAQIQVSLTKCLASSNSVQAIAVQVIY